MDCFFFFSSSKKNQVIPHYHLALRQSPDRRRSQRRSGADLHLGSIARRGRFAPEGDFGPLVLHSHTHTHTRLRLQRKEQPLPHGAGGKPRVSPVTSLSPRAVGGEATKAPREGAGPGGVTWRGRPGKARVGAAAAIFPRSQCGGGGPSRPVPSRSHHVRAEPDGPHHGGAAQRDRLGRLQDCLQGHDPRGHGTQEEAPGLWVSGPRALLARPSRLGEVAGGLPGVFPPCPV